MKDWFETKVLIIGKTYPEISKKHVETVCTGGITEAGNLVRMYPIPFRYWAKEKRYKLFSWVKVRLSKDPVDKRKESHKVQEDSFEILSQVKSWPDRMSLLRPVISTNLEDLGDQYKQDWTSLGIIPIDFEDLKMEWRDQQMIKKKKSTLAQELLFEKRKKLDQPPIKLVLRYRCHNSTRCGGHKHQLLPWEYIEAFRKWVELYDAATAFDMLGNKLRKYFADPKKENLALVGTHSRFGSWMLGGLFFPPKSDQSTMFDLFQ